MKKPNKTKQPNKTKLTNEEIEKKREKKKKRKKIVFTVVVFALFIIPLIASMFLPYLV